MNYLKHNIRNLYLIKIAKWFMLTMPILMLFYQDLGFSTQESFWLKAAYSIAIVIFELPSGLLADRWGHKMALQIGSVLGTLGFLIYSVWSGFYSFLVAEIILGLGMSFISGADSAMIYDTLRAHSREKEYVKFESRNFSVGNFSEAFAGLAGGALAAIHLRYPFYAQTVVAFIAIPAAWSLVEPLTQRKENRPTISVRKMLSEVFIQNKPLRYHLILSSILGSTTLAMAWIYPLILNEMGYNTIEIGIWHTVLNLLLGFATLWAYQIEQKLKPQATVWLTTLALTGTFIAIGLLNEFWMPLLLVTFYFSRAIATPVLKDYILKVTPDSIRASVLSLRSLLIRGIFSLLGPFFGYYADRNSLREALVVTGIIVASLAMALITLFLKSFRAVLSKQSAHRANQQ